jgi:hypothetical protein
MENKLTVDFYFEKENGSTTEPNSVYRLDYELTDEDINDVLPETISNIIDTLNVHKHEGEIILKTFPELKQIILNDEEKCKILIETARDHDYIIERAMDAFKQAYEGNKSSLKKVINAPDYTNSWYVE